MEQKKQRAEERRNKFLNKNKSTTEKGTLDRKGIRKIKKYMSLYI